MNKEKKTTQSTDEVEIKQPVVIPYSVEKGKKIVCPVCGHANPEHTALCENCSNYL